MLESRNTLTKVLQLTVIILTSIAASYIFQNTRMDIQVNEINAYYYIAYAITIVLCYACVSHYNKYLAFSLSSALLGLAVFGPGQKVIELFPVYAPLLATSIGVLTVLLVPAAKGKEFIAFLFMLLLPVLLVESRVGGYLFLTLEGSVAFYEAHVVTIAVIGGCFYLRYATSTNLTHQELVSRGGSKEDVSAVSWWSNLIVAVVVAGSIATAALLPFATPVLVNILQPNVAGIPLFIFVLGLGVGVVVTMIYALQTSTGE